MLSLFVAMANRLSVQSRGSSKKIAAKRNSRKKAQKNAKKAEMQWWTDSGNRGDGGSLPM
jgi:hypothetical protein